MPLESLGPDFRGVDSTWCRLKKTTLRVAFPVRWTRVPTGDRREVRASGLLLAQLGINPQVLAVIGATPEQTREIVLAARGLCEARGDDFDAAEATVAEIQTDVSKLTDLVQRGFASDQELARLATQRQALADALDARAAIQQQVREVIDGILTPDQVTSLNNIVAARDVVVPTHWKVEPRDDRGWIELRDQLAQARTEAREANGSANPSPRGEPAANPQARDLPLRDPPMSDAVLLAKSRSETNRQSVAHAWRAAIED